LRRSKEYEAGYSSPACAMERSHFSGADRICRGSAEDGTSGTHRDHRLSFHPLSHPIRRLRGSPRLDDVFAHFPVLTLIHIVPACFFMTLGPLQFSSTIRANYLRWHRLSGRIFVVCGVVNRNFGASDELRVPAIVALIRRRRQRCLRRSFYSRCAKRFGISGSVKSRCIASG